MDENIVLIKDHFISIILSVTSIRQFLLYELWLTLILILFIQQSLYYKCFFNLYTLNPFQNKRFTKKLKNLSWQKDIFLNKLGTLAAYFRLHNYIWGIAIE